MNTFLSIIALILLAVLSWIAGYVVCLTILSRSLWSPRLHLEQRFPPQRFKKINRLVSSVAGLIVVAVVMYFSAPVTIQSLQSSPPQMEVPPLNDVNH